MLQRVFVSVFAENLAETKYFYRSLLGFEVEYDSNWFVQLKAPNNAALELGILSKNSDLIPGRFRHPPQGCLLTVVVDDVDVIYARARVQRWNIVEAPRNLFYGQRRMLIQDPAGTLVDVSSECEPSPDFLADLPTMDMSGGD